MQAIKRKENTHNFSHIACEDYVSSAMYIPVYLNKHILLKFV